MKSFEYVLQDELGLHARPAGLLVKAASAFKSDIKVSNGTREVDAKRIMAVMSLGAKQGQALTFFAEGPDEGEASETLEKFMKENV